LAFTVKFHPSSHSSEFTVVVTHRNSKIAHQATVEIGGICVENRQIISSQNTGIQGLEQVTDELKSFEPKQIDDYYWYQEARITFIIPKGSTPKCLALIDAQKAFVILYLINMCGQPKISQTKHGEKWVFDYRGDKIAYSKNESNSRKCRFRIEGRKPIVLNGRVYVRNLVQA